MCIKRIGSASSSKHIKCFCRQSPKAEVKSNQKHIVTLKISEICQLRRALEILDNVQCADCFVQQSDTFIADVNLQLQTMSEQLNDLRSDLVVKMENLENAQKADSNTFVDET